MLAILGNCKVFNATGIQVTWAAEMQRDMPGTHAELKNCKLSSEVVVLHWRDLGVMKGFKQGSE